MTHLVVGELCADIVVALDGDPVFGQAETIVPSTQVVMGSSSAITACGLARMGVETQLVSVVGDDLLGGFLLDELRRREVDVRHVRLDGSVPTGTSTILTRPDGDRAILTALGSIGRTTVADAPADLSGVRHVHVGSYFLQHALHGELADWFAHVRSAGITTSLDPNADPEGTWDSDVRAVLRHVDVLFCNEEEARGIAGSQDPVPVLSRLLPPGGRLLLKRGAAGAELRGADGTTIACPVPEDPHPLRDTVGAGDSLAAGYLAARARGRSEADALRIGVRNGTASTRAAGGTAGQLSWDRASGRRSPR